MLCGCVQGIPMGVTRTRLHTSTCGSTGIVKGRWLHHTSFLWDFQAPNMEYLKVIACWRLSLSYADQQHLHVSSPALLRSHIRIHTRPFFFSHNADAGPPARVPTKPAARRLPHAAQGAHAGGRPVGRSLVSCVCSFAFCAIGIGCSIKTLLF